MSEKSVAPAIVVFNPKTREEHLKKLKEAVNRFHQDQMEIAFMLRDIAEGQCDDGKKFYEAYGYEDFRSFCEGELGMGERKGYYLLSVVRETMKSSLDEEKVRKLEWTKASVLAEASKKHVMTESNADEWYTKAASSSYRDLRDSLDTELKKRGKTATQKKTSKTGEDIFVVNIGLFQDQYENWQLALQKAKVMTDSTSEPHLIDTIASCFLSESYDTKRDSLQTICERVERAFGVKLVAVDPESQDILHGEDFAASMDAEDE